MLQTAENYTKALFGLEVIKGEMYLYLIDHDKIGQLTYSNSSPNKSKPLNIFFTLLTNLKSISHSLTDNCLTLVL